MYIPAWLQLLAQLWFLPLTVGLFFHWASRYLQGECAYWLGEKAFSYLTAPGVIAHELAHAITCIPFAHRIDELVLFRPDRDGTLGYVKHSYNARNPWAVLGNGFIGTAPLWSGIILLHFLFAHAFPHLDQWKQALNHPWTWLWIYLMVAIGAHMRLSVVDLRGSWVALLLWTLLFGVFLYFAPYGTFTHSWMHQHSLLLIQSLQIPVVTVWLFLFAGATLLRILRWIRS